ncbi:sensor histidine kinase [Fusibacter sp. JL216-2]|uniref:sensor histidine kinase n=1 Tax=Fusibacter sp. JL216-2 TaxID=3071453 RepID=UPI003D33F4C1
MNTKGNENTLSKFIYIVTSVSIAVMGLFMLSFMAFQLTKTIDQIEVNHIDNNKAFIESVIISFLDVREAALEDVASQSIVIKSTLHPENTHQLIKEYLDGLTLLSKDYNMSLYDMNGQVIYKESNISELSDSDNSWIEKLVSGELTHYITIHENKVYWWFIAVPVIHNGSTYGILTAEIPVTDIFASTEIKNMPRDMKLDLLYDNTVILSVGEVNEGITHYDNIEEIDVTIAFTLDRATTNHMINMLLLSHIIAIIVMTFITIAILIYLSKRFITMPVNEIRCLAMQLAEGKVEEIEFTDSKIVELKALTNQFIDMSSKIRERESDLLDANASLEIKNEQLKTAVSKLEDAQGQMIQQEKLASIGHLAAGVAHELNNPIGFVSSNFSILKNYFEDLSDYIKSQKDCRITDDIQYIVDDIPELISDSQEGLNRVTSIVKNLRNFSRVDNFERSDYDLNKGIESTLIVAKNEYKYVADVETDLSDIPVVYAKGSEINDVLLNLIINATHAISSLNMSEKGVIRIKTYSDNNHVSVEITDNGPGIQEEVIPRIFDPFFTTKEPGKGTGLGLNIAYNTIVNKHNGVLEAKSKYGEGATFTVRLPIADSETLMDQDDI